MDSSPQTASNSSEDSWELFTLSLVGTLAIAVAILVAASWKHLRAKAVAPADHGGIGAGILSPRPVYPRRRGGPVRSGGPGDREPCRREDVERQAGHAWSAGMAERPPIHSGRANDGGQRERNMAPRCRRNSGGGLVAGDGRCRMDGGCKRPCGWCPVQGRKSQGLKVLEDRLRGDGV
jgi:hypothetical protein